MLDIVAPLCYPNNKETAYYIEGYVAYTWEEGKQSHEFHQVLFYYDCDVFKKINRKEKYTRRLLVDNSSFLSEANPNIKSLDKFLFNYISYERSGYI